MSRLQVPYVDLRLQHKAIRGDLHLALDRVLDHGQFILGPEVEVFERSFAEYCGAAFASGVDNGTNALILAMKALGIGAGDEVITVPNSFLASTSAIILVGATTVFVDVGEDMNLDPGQIESAITSRTRAILPVHLTGRPAAMDKILKIAREHHLFVIEDCAQAIGAKFEDTMVGSFGDMGCFSFHPLKTLNVLGDGGMIMTSHEAWDLWIKQARNHGLRTRDEVEFWSMNSRLDTLHAAMLLVKMECLERWTQERREIAEFYQSELGKSVTIPIDKPEEYSVYHTFVIRVDRRDELQAYLLKNEIETRIHYPIPLHLQAPARVLGYARGSLPVAERQVDRILSLPIYPGLETWQMEKVVEGIREFYGDLS